MRKRKSESKPVILTGPWRRQDTLQAARRAARARNVAGVWVWNGLRLVPLDREAPRRGA